MTQYSTQSHYPDTEQTSRSPNLVVVIFSTDLSDKEPHRQVDVDRVMISGRLGGVMVSTLAQNIGGIGSNHAPGEIYPILINPMVQLMPSARLGSDKYQFCISLIVI